MQDMKMVTSKMSGYGIIAGILLTLSVINAEPQGPYYFQSHNIPTRHLSFSFNSPSIRLSNEGKRFWVHSPGLTGQEGTVTFESMDKPGYYLRHINNNIELDPVDGRNPDTFTEDATYTLYEDKWYLGYDSFESVNRANHYIHHFGNLIRLATYDDTQLFRTDAAFRKQQGPYVMQPSRHPMLKLGLDNLHQALVQETGLQIFIISPGLTGEPGTVSFEVKAAPSSYLREHGSYLNFESHFQPVNRDTFDIDATFILRKDYFQEGYYAIESTKYPGRFIRQLDYRLRIMQNSQSDAFQRDACFRMVEGPALLESYDMDYYKLDVNEDNKATLTINGSSFHMISPSLNGEMGTVSLQLIRKPDHFLRRRNMELVLEHKDKAKDKNEFPDDAAFYVREELWRSGAVISLECYGQPGQYMMHNEYEVNIGTYDETAQFVEAATFYKKAGRPELTIADGEFIDDEQSSPDYTGAIVGSLFGGLFLGMIIVCVGLFMFDKFYLKAIFTQPSQPLSFDNMVYKKDTTAQDTEQPGQMEV